MQHQCHVPTIPISSRRHGLESFCETYPISASKVISYENGFFTSKVIYNEIGLVEERSLPMFFFNDRLSLYLVVFGRNPINSHFCSEKLLEALKGILY